MQESELTQMAWEHGFTVERQQQEEFIPAFGSWVSTMMLVVTDGVRPIARFTPHGLENTDRSHVLRRLKDAQEKAKTWQ